MPQDEIYAVVTEAAMAIVKENVRLWNARAHALNYQIHPYHFALQSIYRFCFKNAQMW